MPITCGGVVIYDIKVAGTSIPRSYQTSWRCGRRTSKSSRWQRLRTSNFL
jgi:hypothetical protein